jgi:DNA repair exonuclease SbcCD ATPase subunit
MVGKQYVIPDVAAIIEALKRGPVQSPQHKIHLDSQAKMLFYNVCRQSTDCESIIQSIVQLCQQLFRNTNSVTVIKEWLQWMNELLSLLSSPGALNKMTDIAVAIEQGLPRDLTAEQIDEIRTKTRSLKELQIQQDFCSKVDPGLQTQDPKAALNRLLTNAHQELNQKMQHLEEFEAQQENMKRLSDDLEREQAERKKEHEEQQAKIKSVEASCDQKVSEMKALLDEEVKNGKRTKDDAAKALATAMSEQAAIRDREIAELHKKFSEDQEQKQEQVNEVKAQLQRSQEESARVAREHNAKIEQMQAEQRRQQQQIEEERQQERRRREEEIRVKEKELTYVMLPLYQNGRFVKMCLVHPDDVPDWRREHDC